MKIPQILKFDDSSWGCSVRFSPFAIVVGQKRSIIAHFLRPSGGVRDFHSSLQGGLHKGGIQHKMQSLGLVQMLGDDK